MSELLEIRDLHRSFRIKPGLNGRGGGTLRAVDGVSFAVGDGEAVGLVGESGCGKSTLGTTILRLQDPDRGEILLRGQHLETLKRKELQPFRREMQLIFQDPYSALNPREKILRAVEEPLRAFGLAEGQVACEQAAAFLARVGLGAGEIRKYPHELSGGQRQRVVIARAMICKPSFVVCDEPVSALDASVRAQVLNLMRGLQREMGVSYLFISHDLSVVRFLCDRVLVMYLGKIMESASRAELFEHAAHPYTQALMRAIPIPDVTRRRTRIVLEGELPDPLHLPAGCRFASRCPRAAAICREEEPALRECAPGHRVACHLA